MDREKNHMKTKLILAVGMLTCGLACLAQENKAADPGTNVLGGEILPQVTIVDTPLPTAINNLARMANVNVIIDERITAGTPGPDGKIPAPKNVTLKWENVTALQALTALLDNNNLQLVMNDKTHISKITAKDPTALEPLVATVLPLKYSNPSNVVVMLQPTLSARSRIIADGRTGQLIILSTDAELTQIRLVLSKLDTSPSQILIEARFLETTRNPRSIKGIDWSDTLSGQRFSFGNGIASGSTSFSKPPGSSSESTSGTTVWGAGIGGLSANTAMGLTPGIGFLNAQGVNAVLSFLNTDSDAQSLATPRAVALEGVPTELSVVRNIPVFEEEQGANAGGVQQPNTVKANYALNGPNGTILNEVGTKLVVTPRIYGVTNVFLDLKPEISTIEAQPASQTLSGRVSTAPIFARRKLVTQAMVPSGNTLVLGGLVSHDAAKNMTKVPLLGDLPGIGRAFRSDDKTLNKRNLMIFITPTIVDTTDYQPNDAARDFLKHRASDPVDAEWIPYDSAVPYDWTKPLE